MSDGSEFQVCGAATHNGSVYIIGCVCSGEAAGGEFLGSGHPQSICAAVVVIVQILRLCHGGGRSRGHPDLPNF